ncbi:UEV domain-containing protein [Phthorimaea operculella]|nr:UEV domain-containing protein [Phthorimaea operculella]
MANDDVALKQYLSKYRNRDYTAREVINLIQVYRSLTYRLEAFVFNNGTRKDLLNLEGTIPVNYKGAYYNIPICIWLMDTHPQNAPLCFVKPTPDMSIKVSKYVDSNGKVYLPYLHEWTHNGSTLQALVQVMITAFGELPPVYSKPRNETRAPYPVNSFMPQPSGFPYPSVADTWISKYHALPNRLKLALPKLWDPYPGAASTNGTPYPPAATTTPYPPAAGSASPALTLLEAPSRGTSKPPCCYKERSELDKNVAILQEKEKELETAVERLSEQEGIDVDEAVVTTAPLYSQLLNAFAEEATLEDAIYYMGEALRKEVIDLDTFLKQVRTLACRQFTLRALMHKCRQKLNLLAGNEIIGIIDNTILS